MTADEPGRPQDQGRRHRRRGSASGALGDSLLATYLETLRGELRDVLVQLAPTPDNQLQLDGRTAPPKRPSLADRGRLVDLAVKLRGALGSEVDPMPPAPPVAAAAPRRRRGRVDFG